MSELEKVRSFLDSMTYREEREGREAAAKGIYPFVTISRQTGAGGHTLAEALVAEMEKERGHSLFAGWQILDQELCKKIAEDPELKISMASLLSEEYRSEIEDMIDELTGLWSPQYKIIRKMFEMIRAFATFGKVIIVGRGGSCLTRGLPLGIHVRLVASLPSRIQRMMRLLNLPEKKAREVVGEQDRSRRKLLKDYFNRDIEDPLLYDVIWNTDTVPIPEIARTLVGLVREKAILVGSGPPGRIR